MQGYAGLGAIGNQFGGTFLRSSTGNQVRLTLTGLPAHRTISLEFLFAAIDSLDGAGTYPAGDYFKITLDGTPIFREAFANALPTQIQACALGTSNTTFMSAPLPLPLGFIGALDCWLLLDAAVTSAYPMTLAGTSASTTLNLPPEQSVIGFQLYAQGWAVAPGANAGGLVFSGGLRLVVGR